VVNAAKSRFFDLEPGDDMSFTKIGDDSGLQEYSQQLDSLVLAPGERQMSCTRQPQSPARSTPFTRVSSTVDTAASKHDLEKNCWTS